MGDSRPCIIEALTKLDNEEAKRFVQVKLIFVGLALKHDMIVLLQFHQPSPPKEPNLIQLPCYIHRLMLADATSNSQENTVRHHGQSKVEN